MGELTPPTGAQLQGPILSVFEPQYRIISSMTNEENAVVTTVEEHGFTTGWYVRLDVPLAYGMGADIYEQVVILVIDEVTFSTDFDTTNLNPFVTPTYPPSFTLAQAIPISGETRNTAGPLT